MGNKKTFLGLVQPARRVLIQALPTLSGLVRQSSTMSDIDRPWLIEWSLRDATKSRGNLN